MLLATLILPLLAATTSPRLQQQPPARRDTARADTTRRRRHGRVPRQVTDELRQSAFHDPLARDLYDRARLARIRQDSTLRSYDAKVVQRITFKAAIGRVPLEKLAYRQDHSARVRWERGIGARVDVTGARVAVLSIAVPEMEQTIVREQLSDISLIPIPY